jgi:uncharacterized protein with PIN domain
MITVQTCSTLPEAQIVQSVLRGSGVQAFLPDEMTVQNNWMWTNAIGVFRVQVLEEDVERAAEVLQVGAPAEAEKRCPRCGAVLKKTYGLGVYPKIALALLFSIPLRSKPAWKCPKCGATTE